MDASIYKKLNLLGQINKQIETLTLQRTKLMGELVSIISVYYVGQIVDVRGYSFRGRKCRIETLTLYPDLNLVVRARLLLKDGKDSKFMVQWESVEDKIQGAHMQNLANTYLHKK